jgi:hypothetical protein
MSLSVVPEQVIIDLPVVPEQVRLDLPIVHEQVRLDLPVVHEQVRLDLPIVHEQVRCPDVSGWYPDILNIPILGGVPPQVGIIPLLKYKEDNFIFCFLFLSKF